MTYHRKSSRPFRVPYTIEHATPRTKPSLLSRLCDFCWGFLAAVGIMALCFATGLYFAGFFGWLAKQPAIAAWLAGVAQ